MNIALVEWDSEGHRLVYLRHLADYLLGRGHNVTLAVAPGVQDSQEFALHVNDIADSCTLAEISGQRSPRGLAKSLDEADIDTVIVPDGDRFALRLAIEGWPWKGRGRLRILIMQDPRWELRALREDTRTRPRRSIRLLRMLLKKWMLEIAAYRRGVDLLWLRPPVAGLGVNEVPDPVTMDAINPSIELDCIRTEGDPYWYGIFGVINERKNAELILRAISRGVTQRAVGLVLNGPISADYRERLLNLNRELGNRVALQFDSRHFSDAGLNSALRLVDCAVVAYATHAPPSTIGKAIAAGTRVIVCGSNVLQEHALRMGTPLVGPLEEGAMAQLAAKALNVAKPKGRWLSGPKDFARALSGV